MVFLTELLDHEKTFVVRIKHFLVETNKNKLLKILRQVLIFECIFWFYLDKKIYTDTD